MLCVQSCVALFPSPPPLIVAPPIPLPQPTSGRVSLSAGRSARYSLSTYLARMNFSLSSLVQECKGKYPSLFSPPPLPTSHSQFHSTKTSTSVVNPFPLIPCSSSFHSTISPSPGLPLNYFLVPRPSHSSITSYSPVLLFHCYLVPRPSISIPVLSIPLTSKSPVLPFLSLPSPQSFYLPPPPPPSPGSTMRRSSLDPLGFPYALGHLVANGYHHGYQLGCPLI